MAKYSITVIRTDEYEIEVDENNWNADYIKEWAKSFYPAEDAEDIAKHLAGAIMHEGSEKRQWETISKPFTEEDYTKGLSIKIITENDDYEFEIEQKEE